MTHHTPSRRKIALKVYRRSVTRSSIDLFKDRDKQHEITYSQSFPHEARNLVQRNGLSLDKQREQFKRAAREYRAAASEHIQEQTTRVEGQTAAHMTAHLRKFDKDVEAEFNDRQRRILSLRSTMSLRLPSKLREELVAREAPEVVCRRDAGSCSSCETSCIDTNWRLNQNEANSHVLKQTYDRT